MPVWLSHSCPPSISSLFWSEIRFLFLNQLNNRTMQFVQLKLLFLSLFSPFNVVTLEDTLQKNFTSDTFLWISTVVNSFFFYLLGYLLQLIFATSLFTSPLSSWYAKWPSLYREIGACQYADTTDTGHEPVNFEWFWFTNIRTVARTK